jgi:hypothetical protein
MQKYNQIVPYNMCLIIYRSERMRGWKDIRAKYENILIFFVIERFRVIIIRIYICILQYSRSFLMQNAVKNCILYLFILIQG